LHNKYARDRGRSERVSCLLAPAPDQSQENEAETAEGEWELYQKEVVSRLHEQAAASSHANNVVEQSVHPSCMSRAEADTFVDPLSVVPTPVALPQGREVGRKGIAEAFNMKKHCEESWRLPIHDSKQDILDKVAANQVVVLSGPPGCGKSTQVPQYTDSTSTCRAPCTRNWRMRSWLSVWLPVMSNATH